jgi:hypothetical protein
MSVARMILNQAPFQCFKYETIGDLHDQTVLFYRYVFYVRDVWCEK